MALKFHGFRNFGFYSKNEKQLDECKVFACDHSQWGSAGGGN